MVLEFSVLVDVHETNIKEKLIRRHLEDQVSGIIGKKFGLDGSVFDVFVKNI